MTSHRPVEGILVDIGSSHGAGEEFDPWTSPNAGSKALQREFPLPHDLVWERTPAKKTPSWKGHPDLIALLGDSWDDDDTPETRSLDHKPKVDALSIQSSIAPDLSSLSLTVPGPSSTTPDLCPTTPGLSSSASGPPSTTLRAPSATPGLSPTAPIYIPQSMTSASFPEPHAKEFAREPKLDQSNSDQYVEQTWLPEVLNIFDAPRTIDQQPTDAPEPPVQFQTYADASNHFYSSLDRSILEKPLPNRPQTLTRPVVPPSHTHEPSKPVSKPEPHSAGRPNWAAAPSDAVQENSHFVYNVQPIDILNRRLKADQNFSRFVYTNPHTKAIEIKKPSTFARGREMEIRKDPNPSDQHALGERRPSYPQATFREGYLEPSRHDECPPNIAPFPGQYAQDEHTTNFNVSPSQSFQPEPEDPWAVEMIPNWEVLEKKSPTETQPARTQPAYTPEQFFDASDVVDHFVYAKDSPPHQRSRSRPRAGPPDDNRWSHDRFEHESVSYRGYEMQTAPREEYGKRSSLGNDGFAPPPRTAARPHYGAGSSTTSFADPTVVDHGWGPVGNDSNKGLNNFASRSESTSAPEPPKMKHPLAVFSKRTSRDPNFILPPPDEEPPLDHTWDAPEWRSYSGKRGRPLRLPPD